MEAKDRRGEKIEESKKCPVLADEYASHSVTPDEFSTHPVPSRAKEGMVFFLGYVDPNDQMVLRSPDLFLELTEFLEPGILYFVH
jgi:hypothetical protein